MSLLPDAFHAKEKEKYIPQLDENQKDLLVEVAKNAYWPLLDLLPGSWSDVLEKASRNMLDGKGFCAHGSWVDSYERDFWISFVEITDRLADENGELVVCDLFSDPSFIRDLASKSGEKISGTSVGIEEEESPDENNIWHIQWDLSTLHAWRQVLKNGPYGLIVARPGYGLSQVPLSTSHALQYLEAIWDALDDGGEAYIMFSFLEVTDTLITANLLRSRFRHMEGDCDVIDIENRMIDFALDTVIDTDTLTPGAIFQYVYLKKDDAGSLIRRISGVKKNEELTSSIQIGQLEVSMQDDFLKIQNGYKQATIDKEDVVDYTWGWADNVAFDPSVPMSLQKKNETLLYLLMCRKLEKDWNTPITTEEVQDAIDAVAQIGVWKLYQLVYTSLSTRDREYFEFTIV